MSPELKQTTRERVSRREASEIEGCDIITLWRREKAAIEGRGDHPVSHWIGNRRFFYREEIAAWLAKQMSPQTDDERRAHLENIRKARAAKRSNKEPRRSARAGAR